MGEHRVARSIAAWAALLLSGCCGAASPLSDCWMVVALRLISIFEVRSSLVVLVKHVLGSAVSVSSLVPASHISLAERILSASFH